MSGVGMMLLGSGAGLTAPSITIADRIISDTEAYQGSTAAVAGYGLYSDGLAYQTTSNTGTVSIGNWVTPTSAAANYEVLATLVSGFVSVGTVGSWLALNTDRGWSKLKVTSSVGSSFCVIQIDIRKIGTTTILDTAQIQLAVEIV